MIEAVPKKPFVDTTCPLQVKESLKCKLLADEDHHLLQKSNCIGNFIREKMLFPFHPQRAAPGHLSSSELFWETDIPDVHYPFKEEIKNHFDRYEQTIEIQKQGKVLKLKCLVIESKHAKEHHDVQNHLIVQGNTSDLKNNTPGIIPFLDSHIKNLKQQADVKPARFIVFNHYDNHITYPQGQIKRYLPANMDEWGFVFKKAVETFTQEYGKFNSISAHSLGNMPILAQLKHFRGDDFARLFPQTLFLSKGASSIYESSKNVPFQLNPYPWGWLLLMAPIMYFFAKLTGWTFEFDQTLVNYLKSVPKTRENIDLLKNMNLVLTEVKHDYYFPGKASLCASKKLDELEKLPLNLYRLSFRLPPTRTTKKGQHNYNLGGFQRQHLEKEDLVEQGRRMQTAKKPQEVFYKQMEHHLFLKHGMTLTDLVINSSLRI
jgi:hypothetical protein